MRAPLLLAATLALVLAAGPVADARACGAFFGPPPPQGPTTADLRASLPRLAIEQVLLIYDDRTQTEHLIRELRFDGADRSFGFVIPVPARPTIERVASAPFDKLTRDFSFEGPDSASSGSPRGGGKGGPPGAIGGGAAPPPPVVLEKRRIGKLTAFVLEASNAAGLDAWLKQNGFTTTSESSAWLDHQVKQGFYFVALRYDAPARGAKGGMTSETLRITFQTPEPYYPYLEPDHADDDASRMLLLWYVGRQPRTPVAAVSPLPSEADVASWKRPWLEGHRYHDDPRVLATALGGLASLLPTDGQPYVQTFRDRKSSRRGWSDVLLLSRGPRPAGSETFLAAHRPFFSILDPALPPLPFGPSRALAAPASSGAPPLAGSALPTTSPAPRAPAPPGAPAGSKEDL